MRDFRRWPLPVLAMTLLLASAGCRGGKNSADPQARAQEEVHRVVQDVVKAYGGAAALGRVRAYRAEGILTATRHREQGDLVRWFERPDRLRIELRHPDRGDVRIASGEVGWAGPEDRLVQPLTGVLLEGLRLEAARLDLPLRLAEQESSLVLMDPDDRERAVLRLPLRDGALLEYHVVPGKHRIERVSMRLSGPTPTELAVDLSEFRWVHGVLFPFREDAYADGARTGIVRFRSLKTNPEIAPEIFSPSPPP